jgi:hypothetical protein
MEFGSMRLLPGGLHGIAWDVNETDFINMQNTYIWPIVVQNTYDP